jgi:hypothetical protein
LSFILWPLVNARLADAVLGEVLVESELLALKTVSRVELRMMVFDVSHVAVRAALACAAIDETLPCVVAARELLASLLVEEEATFGERILLTNVTVTPAALTEHVASFEHKTART